MKKSQYRDRYGALNFNLTIDGVELTTICTILTQYILDNGTNANHIIKQRIESAKDILKTLEEHA